jgi:hypothetical protein
MPWLYDTHTGLVEHQNEAEYLLDQPGNALGSGLVNLGIPDSDTMAQAVAASQAYVKAHGGTTPTTSNATANKNAESTIEGAIPGLSQVGDFFDALTQRNTWIRVAKILVGGVLVIIGLAHISGAGNAVATVAKKVPLPV